MVANAIVVSVVIRPLLIQLIQFFIALERVMNGLHLLIVCSKAIPAKIYRNRRGYLGYTFLLETQIVKRIKTNGF